MSLHGGVPRYGPHSWLWCSQSSKADGRRSTFLVQETHVSCTRNSYENLGTRNLSLCYKFSYEFFSHSRNLDRLPSVLLRFSCILSPITAYVYVLTALTLVVSYLEQVDSSLFVSYRGHGLRRVTRPVKRSAAKKTKSVVLPDFVSWHKTSNPLLTVTASHVLTYN